MSSRPQGQGDDSLLSPGLTAIMMISLIIIAIWFMAGAKISAWLTLMTIRKMSLLSHLPLVGDWFYQLGADIGQPWTPDMKAVRRADRIFGWLAALPVAWFALKTARELWTGNKSKKLDGLKTRGVRTLSIESYHKVMGLPPPVKNFNKGGPRQPMTPGELSLFWRLDVDDPAFEKKLRKRMAATLGSERPNPKDDLICYVAKKVGVEQNMVEVICMMHRYRSTAIVALLAFARDSRGVVLIHEMQERFMTQPGLNWVWFALCSMGTKGAPFPEGSAIWEHWMTEVRYGEYGGIKEPCIDQSVAAFKKALRLWKDTGRRLPPPMKGLDFRELIK